MDLDDCVWAKKYLIATGYVDENKIGITGGSYREYMVLAVLTFRAEEFTVGVDLFGISNWVRMLENIPPWWKSFKKALYAENIVRPWMVLQGENDPRVLKIESDEIVEEIKKNGVPVEYIVFDDEGHGFVNKENQIEGYSAVLDF